MSVSSLKQIASARRQRERRARRARRRQVWACFWTRPLGHRYETPDGLTASEVFVQHNPEVLVPHLRCVGCGCGYVLFDYSEAV